MVSKVFVRDDDLANVSPTFLSFYALSTQFAIPILYGAIPAKLDTKMKKFIKEKNLQIAQHGYLHKNHGTTTKYEFGNGRSEEEQRQEIRKGMEILQKELPEQFHPIFIPPFHEFDETTLAILEEYNLEVSVPYEVNMNNLKVHISLQKYGSNVTSTTFEEFSRELLRNIKQHKQVGIYAHHEDFDFKEGKKIFQFLRALHASGKIQLIDFGDRHAHS